MRERILVLETRFALRVHQFDRVFLLQRIDQRVETFGEALFPREHLQFMTRRETIEGDEMLIPRDLITEKSEGSIERLIVPLLRVDENAVHVEYDGFDHWKN